jgi:hypothetical protein
MKKFFLLSAFFLLCATGFVQAQTHPLKLSDSPEDTVPKLMGQNANLYNQITDIFQAAVRNGIISNSGGEYQLTTSLYGLKMLFHKGAPLSDIDYIKSKFQRNFNITAIIGTNSTDNSIQSFSPSIKYAIINKRDVKDFGNAPKDQRDSLFSAFNLLDIIADSTTFQDQIRGAKNDPAKHDKMKKALNNLQTLKDTSASAIEQYLTTNGFNLTQKDKATIEHVVHQYKNGKDIYTRLVGAIQQGPLLTLHGGATIKNNAVNGIDAKLEYLVGLGSGVGKDPNKPWDFDTYASANIQKDSVTKSQTLDRQVYSAYVGINKVLAYTSQQSNKGVATQSLFEAKGSTGFDYIPTGRYPTDRTWTYNLDVIFSVRLANNLYLPFEIKYAPTKSSVLGLLKLQFNLPNLSKSP